MATRHGHGRVGDVLFSEDGRTCPHCGWQTFWARGGDFRTSVCERCGQPQPRLGLHCQRGVCQKGPVVRDETGGEWCGEHANDETTRALIARIKAEVGP